MYKIWPLVIIFFLGLAIRFLYFPDNVYFSYDQARDSYSALELLGGNLKIIGPPSSFNDNLFHGPLIYYLFAPIYFLGDSNPEYISALLRIVNTLGIILVFFITFIIFNYRAALLSAFLFALSFEQTQFAIFFGHPAPTVILVLIFYLGWSLIIFKKNPWGLAVAFLGLGAAIQFHYSQILLFLPCFLLLFIYRKQISFLTLKHFIISGLIFLLTVSTFILSELKYGFRMTSEILFQLSKMGIDESGGIYIQNVVLVLKRIITDNLISFNSLSIIYALTLLVTILFMLKMKKQHTKVIFLSVWFLVGLIPYLLINTNSYYYNAGSSVGLLIFFAYLLNKVLSKYLLLGITLIIFTIISNLSLITNQNWQGPNSYMVIQPKMLLSDEKRALDYIYTEAKGQPFAIRALSVPLSVNTTWNYLFEWYGQNKYHYLPVWIGPVAEGYPGNIPIINNRSKSVLPQKQFLIIESSVGIREGYKKSYFEEEGFFTTLKEEQNFGAIKVQIRQPY